MIAVLLVVCVVVEVLVEEENLLKEGGDMDIVVVCFTIDSNKESWNLDRLSRPMVVVGGGGAIWSIAGNIAGGGGRGRGLSFTSKL